MLALRQFFCPMRSPTTQHSFPATPPRTDFSPFPISGFGGYLNMASSLECTPDRTEDSVHSEDEMAGLNFLDANVGISKVNKHEEYASSCSSSLSHYYPVYGGIYGSSDILTHSIITRYTAIDSFEHRLQDEVSSRRYLFIIYVFPPRQIPRTDSEKCPQRWTRKWATCSILTGMLRNYGSAWQAAFHHCYPVIFI